MSLEKNSSIVEETLLQIKNLEEAINENAKGILASTMKEEISELVRESIGTSKRTLREQEEPEVGDDEEDEDLNPEEEEVDVNQDVEGQVEDEDGDNQEFNVDFQSFEDEPVLGDNEIAPLDMTGSSPEEVLKVFKAMGDEDGIIIKKDQDNNIHLTDNNTNTEYFIQTDGDLEEETSTQMMENIIYELEVDEDEMTDESWNEQTDEELGESWNEGIDNEFDEEYTHSPLDLSGLESPESNETVYEIDSEDLENVMEAFKAVGMGMGKVKKGMSTSSVNNKGFKDEKSEAPKGGGRGPKFKYPKIKQGVTEQEDTLEDDEIIAYEGWEDDENTAETKEASRTMTYRRRAERDRVAAPSQLRKESTQKEINLLKEKNEEYKKALDFFRNKLNEVAVFNSNLAYSTRLFTEHSTTKQEKINILRRFDNVESLKESKSLYKTIKNELDGKNTSVVTESIETKVIKTPTNGSSSNLIESKTYENPQFMRMKDLMTKIK